MQYAGARSAVRAKRSRKENFANFEGDGLAPVLPWGGNRYDHFNTAPLSALVAKAA